MRSNWKAHLRISFVSVPVQAVTANVAQGGVVHFHQLHAPCHSRIKYKKFCPLHGEVPNAEIVQGYEYSRGKYVVIDRDSLDTLSGNGDRLIEIDTFLAPDAIDPLYFDGRNYYLLPDGAAGRQPYAVLAQAMQSQGRAALARCVMARRSQLVLVRAIGRVLMMSVLKYTSQVRAPQTVDEELGQLDVSAGEARLARTLIAASTSKRVDLSKYHDDDTEALQALIQEQVKGHKVVAAPPSEAPAVINLMDALRKSVGQAKSRPTAHTAEPRHASGTGRSTSGPRRKTS